MAPPLGARRHPHLPQKPVPSSIFTLQTDGETKAWRGATSRSQGAKKVGAPRIQARVLAWLIDPQAGAQLVEDMVLGLGTLKPSPGGPAGPTKVSASTISHGPSSLFEMDPYTCSTVSNPPIHPSIHPSIHLSVHPSSIQCDPL